MSPTSSSKEYNLQDFLSGKSTLTLKLFDHLIEQLGQIGPITIYPTKSMIGIAHSGKRIAWVTQLGKNFVHVVFPFKKPYPDNLCFQKIAQVPGDDRQFNHHLRIFSKEDLNEEVMGFMRLAFDGEG
jgi:hypothetical protein